MTVRSSEVVYNFQILEVHRKRS